LVLAALAVRGIFLLEMAQLELLVEQLLLVLTLLLMAELVVPVAAGEVTIIKLLEDLVKRVVELGPVVGVRPQRLVQVVEVITAMRVGLVHVQIRAEVRAAEELLLIMEQVKMPLKLVRVLQQLELQLMGLQELEEAAVREMVVLMPAEMG
jgi:hypothetical protein